MVGQVARMFSEEGHEPSFKKKGGRLSIELDVDSEEEAKALFELVMQKLFGEQ